MNSEKTFNTSDLPLAACLATLAFPVLALESVGNGKVAFIFEGTAELYSAVEKYWRSDVLIEPLRYFNSLKYLKSRLHSELR